MNKTLKAINKLAPINLRAAPEHSQTRTRMLRSEIAKTGKKWNEFSIQEIIDINTKIDAHIKRTRDGYEHNGLHVSGLAPRESHALLLRAQGMSYQRCAAVMNCTPKAVKARINNLFYKFNADSTPDLITRAFKSGALRLLTLLIAMHISISAPFFQTHKDVVARSQRTRTRSSSNAKKSDGIEWIPETNQLILG